MRRSRKRAVENSQESRKHKQAKQANAKTSRANRVANRAAGYTCAACCTCPVLDQVGLVQHWVITYWLSVCCRRTALRPREASTPREPLDDRTNWL